MEDKYITGDQLEEFVRRVDERMDKSEQGKADKSTLRNVSIPVSGWKNNTDQATLAAGLSYYIDVPVSGLTSTDSADTVLDFTSLDMAKACGVAVTSVINDGAIRYFAVEKPTQNLTAQVRVIQVKTA